MGFHWQPYTLLLLKCNFKETQIAMYIGKL